MRKVYTIILVLIFLLIANSTAQKTTLTATQQAYLDTCVPLAQQVMRETGVPVCISLAQAIVESGWGTSTIARKANNHFCIKCSNGWKGKCFEHPDDKIDDQFRVYKSIYDSFKDYGDFLRYNKRYHSLFDLDPNDYKGWANGLKAAGYATNPKYATTLIATIERYNLQQYNEVTNVVTQEKKTVETPVTVAKLEEPVKVKVVKAPAGESYNYSTSRTVFSHNRTEFVVAQKGETYESIAKKFNAFPAELYAYNDVKKGFKPLEGTRVYLQAKRSKAAKGLDKLIVSDETSLWAVSQEYAIKLSKLAKMNGLAPDAKLAPGDELRLR